MWASHFQHNSLAFVIRMCQVNFGCDVTTINIFSAQLKNSWINIKGNERRNNVELSIYALGFHMKNVYRQICVTRITMKYITVFTYGRIYTLTCLSNAHFSHCLSLFLFLSIFMLSPNNQNWFSKQNKTKTIIDTWKQVYKTNASSEIIYIVNLPTNEEKKKYL